MVNNAFNDGPDLPEGDVGYPCSTQVTDDITFYGNEYGYLYDGRLGYFDPIDMPNSAYGASCGAATLQDGTRIIVVAGGDPPNAGVQIYNMDTMQWTTDGPRLPSPLKYGLTVPYGNSFLVVGGRDGLSETDDLDTILEFDPNNMAWITRPESLERPRAFHFVTTVDKERFC